MGVGSGGGSGTGLVGGSGLMNSELLINSSAVSEPLLPIATPCDPLKPMVMDEPALIEAPQSVPVRVWVYEPSSRVTELMSAPQALPLME